jgi:glycosyltransferase involved in cell wall biosynthesis/protein-tyrosine-phosphatase
MKSGATFVTSSQVAEPSTVEGRIPATAERTRLLYLRDTLMVCGPGKTILNTWRTIDRTRFELTIVATRPPEGERNPLLDAADQLGAPAIALSIGRGLDLVAVWRLTQLIRRHRIDVLQTHDSQTRRIGALAAFVTGTRHITSVHGWIFNDRKELLARWIDQRLIRLAESVITVSERLKQDLEKAGVPSGRITPLQNAILLDDYRGAADSAALRQKLGIRVGQPTVSIIGRLSAEKGHAVFLEAARMVRLEVPDATFLIVGDGPLRESLEQQAVAMGLASSVLFTGHISDMAPVYALTDVLAISSFTEGIPNVLLEAFAYGKPAVATSVGGVPEVLEDGVTGRLVPPGDAKPLAEGLVTLLRDNALRDQMGLAAHARIRTRFNFEHRTRALETLYRAKAVDKNNRGARAVLGRFYRSTQARVDRLLHSGRRRRARATLVAGWPSSVLILCYGNICRSPYAAAALAKRVPSDLRILSAGVIRPGRPSPEFAVTAAAARGIDLSPHRSTLITEEMARASDLIVVMDTGQRRTVETRYGVKRRRILVLGDLDPVDITTRTIPDPYARPLDVFHDCYARVDRCIRELADAIATAS